MLPVDKLEHLSRRYRELDDLMCQPNVLADRVALQKLTKERSDLEGLVAKFGRYTEVEKMITQAREALNDNDLRELAEMELTELNPEMEDLVREIKVLLLPPDPHEKKNAILEIRSGEGGEEAALFAADLFRMYSRYAEREGWNMELISMSESATGGIKECISLVTGKEIFSRMRYEGGVHRVQRVPATETQGRIHTSTATVAVLPEAEEVDVVLEDKDLVFSIAASGGPGGQGVNTTNSAVQILHKPSGLIVKCQDERSQLKNKAKALKVLRSRLLDIEREKADAKYSAERKNMVGSAERSAKIRTYNYPQNRVTDHRIKLTINKLDRVIEGDLNELITSLRTHRQAALLQEASGEPIQRASYDDDD
jgi:peptide chain release factor 1